MRVHPHVLAMVAVLKVRERKLYTTLPQKSIYRDL
jgi:hypothetical protein